MDANREEKLIELIDDMATIINDLQNGYPVQELHKDPGLVVLDAKELVDNYHFGKAV